MTQNNSNENSIRVLDDQLRFKEFTKNRNSVEMLDVNKLLDNRRLAGHIYGSISNIKEIKSQFKSRSLSAQVSNKLQQKSSKIRSQYS